MVLTYGVFRWRAVPRRQSWRAPPASRPGMPRGPDRFRPRPDPGPLPLRGLCDSGRPPSRRVQVHRTNIIPAKGGAQRGGRTAEYQSAKFIDQSILLARSSLARFASISRRVPAFDSPGSPAEATHGAIVLESAIYHQDAALQCCFGNAHVCDAGSRRRRQAKACPTNARAGTMRTW